MSKITISGFYDEIGGNLNTQIAAIKELGESYLCPRNIDGKNIADFTFEEFKEKVYPVLSSIGIKFSSIGSPIGKVGIDDEEGFEKQKKQLAELVKIAQLMECEYIRIFSFYYGDKKPADCHDKVVKRLKEFLNIAKGSGVKLMHENEKKVYGDEPERVLAIYNDIADEDFVLCFDASNYVQCNVNPIKAFDMLKDYVVYYHIKDCSKYKVEVPVGTGEGCYEHILSELIKRNYTGFMTLEPHTFKYSMMKLPVYLFPFMPLILKNYFKAFRLIDKKMGVKALKHISRKEVFFWQYKNLKKLLKKAGYVNE
ncbi:MAG: sugar phosphate isomerase/epimerase [Clostridia bacterium]|nr:sugar phosphate isomerase/epimerase [Clostridia bacterium]